jgi:hypothetical protein
MCLCGVLVVGRVLGFPGTPIPSATAEPIAGSVVLLSDGATIAYTDPNGTCRGPVLTPTESPTRVSLALSETDVGIADCVRTFPVLDPYALEVPLAAPLGSRQLVDAMTGNPVPYFDQRRGLHLVFGVGSVWTAASELQDGLVATDSPYFRGPGAAIMVEEMNHYERQNDTAMITVLQIIQVSGGGWHPPPGTVTTPVTVRGHPGLAANGIIVWTEAGMTVALQGYGPSPMPTLLTAPQIAHMDGGPAMDTAALLNLSIDLGGGSL